MLSGSLRRHCFEDHELEWNYNPAQIDKGGKRTKDEIYSAIRFYRIVMDQHTATMANQQKVVDDNNVVAHTPMMDYSSVPTPERCYADFCLVPVGTGELSVAKEVAEVQKLLKASGLTYTMHSAGTTVEGSWDEVMRVIGQAHSVVHDVGPQRIQTSMRVGTRTDKKQTAADKIKRVEDLLAGKK